MRNLFKAFIFKLRKDLTFRITLFIGLGMSILMTLIFLGIDLGMKALTDDPSSYKFLMCTGQNLFITSLSPAQNFGIAIPINLVCFTVLEFSHGTIRNKIITGNSKTKIYLSLILSGLVFTFALIISYSLLCLALGSIFGGFNINGNAGLTGGLLNVEYFWRLIVLAVLSYTVITVVAIFFATLFRNIGPCIPVVIILLMGCYIFASLVSTLGLLGDEVKFIEGAYKASVYFNPIHSVVANETNQETGKLFISNEAFISEIINNVVYIGLFLTGGLLIFKKRDVK